MALVFQRLARNFIKNGYFPTDGETMSRVIQALDFDGSDCRILDPCAGEGTALAEIKHSLAAEASQIEAFGVEYDAERANNAKQILDHVIHGDIQDCMISSRQFGLLFLNPPYGDMVADKAQLSDLNAERIRLEKLFYDRTNTLLQFDGVIVLIIPYYVIDKGFASRIAGHFHDVSIWMAPEQQFKQAVIFGVRHRVSNSWSSTDEFKKTRDYLLAVGNGDKKAPELPATWQGIEEKSGYRYLVPEARSHGRFELVRLDAEQVTEVLGHRRSGLWKQLDMMFRPHGLDKKRPLADVSTWHLALMLAAGQVSGTVRSKTGRVFVVRGDTYKDKKITRSTESNAKGEAVAVRTHTDVFVPAIRGLDMTPGSETYGEVFTIK